MADVGIEQLKEDIQTNIKTNNSQAITGAVLQEQLIDTVDTLKGYTDDHVSVSQNIETGKTELLIGDTPALIVDDKPDANSHNLVESGGVFKEINELNEQIHGVDYSLTDISGFNLHYGVIGSDGKWKNFNSSYQHIVIPVEYVGSKLAITVSATSAQGLNYAYLKSYNNPQSGDSADFCDGQSVRTLNIGQSKNAELLPDDCRYIILELVFDSDVTISLFKLEYKEIGELGFIQNEIDELLDIKQVTGINLFNKDAVSDGQLKNSSGELGTSSTYKTSDFIKVYKDVPITIDGGSRQYLFYDTDKQPITSTYNSTNESPYNPITLIPENNGYLRVSIYSILVEGCQIEYGQLVTPYKNYGTKNINDSVELNTAGLSQLNQMVQPLRINLFTGTVIENGYYDNGVWISNNAYQMVVLAVGAVQNGDILYYSQGFEYYQNQNSFDIFSSDNQYIKSIGSRDSEPIQVSGISGSFYVCMRTRMSYDLSTLIIQRNIPINAKTSIEYLDDKFRTITSLYGKKINCLGDSFTEPSISWAMQLAVRTGCICLNYGKSSSRISVDDDGVLSFLSRYSTMDANSDITIIFGGINDSYSIGAGDIELGNINSALDNTTFYGALKLLITDIKAMMPGKKIIGVIPPDFSDGQYYLDNLANVQNACREVYSYYGIPYADLKKNCQEMFKDDYNNATYRQVTQQNPNFHPSYYGHKAISEIIQGVLQNVIKA